MGVSPINYTDYSDESLMDLVVKEDHEAFSVLVTRYTKMFYAAAYRSCGDQDAAEDIVQDAFLKLWNRPGIWDSSRGAKFSTWFYRVVTNQAIDYMRKQKNTKGSDALERISDDKESAQDGMERGERESMLEGAIQDLPERQKTALNLCFYEGLSNKDAAGIMGVSVKGLESLLMRAKTGLKDTLKRSGMLDNEDDYKEVSNGRG
ncbi:MAG: sigma-70 family RNA polymerase sigma factor [Alphaproteobacteria bacterium]